MFVLHLYSGTYHINKHLNVTLFLTLVINVWNTEHNKRPRSQPFGANDAVPSSHENKFGKAQTMSGHAGKYTPSESVPNLANR